MKIVRLVAALIFLAGLGMLALAVIEWRETRAFLADSLAAEGEVTEQQRRVGSTRKGTSTYYAFRVRFRTSAGSVIEEFALETSSSPYFSQGQKVPVLYARDDPQHFNIDDFTMLWADTVTLFTISGALLASGGGAFWVARGRKVRAEVVAVAFVVPVLLGGAILLLVLANGVVLAIVGAILAWIAIGVIRKKRARSGPP